ncbi:MAG: DUF2164 domain-containing protein [Longimicrobiales bacterium]
MALKLAPPRKQRLIEGLQGFFLEEFDEELSPFRSEQIVDFCLGLLGPQVYNQGVQDARRFLQEKLDDLDGEVHEPEGV